MSNGIVTKKKITLAQIVALLVALASVGCLGCCGLGLLVPEVELSQGERTGTIVKFSHKGVFWKTHEGELNTGAVKQVGKDGAVTSTWEFTVTDPEVVRQVEEAQRKGGTYTLKYRQVMNPKPWNGSSGYYVTQIVTEPK